MGKLFEILSDWENRKTNFYKSEENCHKLFDKIGSFEFDILKNTKYDFYKYNIFNKSGIRLWTASNVLKEVTQFLPGENFIMPLNCNVDHQGHKNNSSQTDSSKYEKIIEVDDDGPSYCMSIKSNEINKFTVNKDFDDCITETIIPEINDENISELNINNQTKSETSLKNQFEVNNGIYGEITEKNAIDTNGRISSVSNCESIRVTRSDATNASNCALNINDNQYREGINEKCNFDKNKPMKHTKAKFHNFITNQLAWIDLPNLRHLVNNMLPCNEINITCNKNQHKNSENDNRIDNLPTNTSTNLENRVQKNVKNADNINENSNPEKIPINKNSLAEESPPRYEIFNEDILPPPYPVHDGDIDKSSDLQSEKSDKNSQLFIDESVENVDEQIVNVTTLDNNNNDKDMHDQKNFVENVMSHKDNNIVYSSESINENKGEMNNDPKIDNFGTVSNITENIDNISYKHISKKRENISNKNSDISNSENIEIYNFDNISNKCFEEKSEDKMNKTSLKNITSEYLYNDTETRVKNLYPNFYNIKNFSRYYKSTIRGYLNKYKISKPSVKSNKFMNKDYESVSNEEKHIKRKSKLQDKKLEKKRKISKYSLKSIKTNIGNLLNYENYLIPHKNHGTSFY